jgi:A/G-specific adenine glycosylase
MEEPFEQVVDFAQLAPLLLSWWDEGHVALPWRESRDPYVIWVAEVMLQQTQIKTVIPYFERWLSRFPTVQVLAEAHLDEVLKAWQGLGYYGRARNLHDAARTVVTEYGGQLPQTVAELVRLKGIGRYTAGAISSIAFDQPAPLLDGNVTRILSRLVDLSADVTKTTAQKQLWQLAADLVPRKRPGDFNQALMELGQQVCLPATPQCSNCPLASACISRQRGTVLERPVRPPRKNLPHYDVVAGIIWQGGQAEPHNGARFLIAQRPLNGLLGGLWEFPGGKQEVGENSAQALRREIREELGMEIEVGRHLTSFKHAYTHFRITLRAFHARHLEGQPENLGVADHAWVKLADVERYAFAVTDRKIIASLEREFAAKTSSG